MLSFCVVSVDEYYKEQIVDSLKNNFSDRDTEYEIVEIEYGKIKNAEIWDMHNFDMAIFDVSDDLLRYEIMKTSLYAKSAIQSLKIVFFSDDLLAALDVFEYTPDYFLYKDRLNEKMPQMLKKLFSYESNNNGRGIVVKTRATKHFIPEQSIMYFEHYQHDTKIVCEDRTVVCHEKLDDLLKRLDSKNFVRSHCSYIVNLQYVREFRRTQLKMSNGCVIPCSRVNQKNVMTLLSSINSVIL